METQKGVQMQTVETAFFEQWRLLTDKQKDLLFNIVLNFNNKPEQLSQSQVPHEHWERISKEQEAHLNGSKNYPREEVKEMARKKEKRHGLPSRD